MADSKRNGNGSEFISDGLALLAPERRRVEEVNIGTEDHPQIVLVRAMKQGDVLALPGEIEQIPERNRLVLAMSCVKPDGSPLWPAACAAAVAALAGLKGDDAELRRLDELENRVSTALVQKANRLGLVTVGDLAEFNKTSPLATPTAGSTDGPAASENPIPN